MEMYLFEDDEPTDDGNSSTSSSNVSWKNGTQSGVEFYV